MTNKILFLQPRTYAEKNYINSHGSEQRWIPWFALLLAPIARELNVVTELVDCRVRTSWKQNVQFLMEGDMLAVSVITGHSIRDAVEASELAQAGGARVVWGGPHVSLFPEETIREAPVDAVVCGPGYNAMQALSEAIHFGYWPPRGATGLRACAKSRQTGIRYKATAVPTPDFDLVGDWESYVNSDVALASRTVNYVASEGCARRCTFCSEPVISKKSWSPHDIEHSLAAIKKLCSCSDANGLKFHDANFFHDRERAVRFAARIKAELDMPFAATIHPADLASLSESELAALSNTGLARLLVGLESPRKSLTKLAGKQYDPSIAPRLAAQLADVGIRGMFTFIVGWPGAPECHYSETIEAADRLREIWKEHQAKIHFLEPWPGTPIFRMLQHQGFKSPRNLEEWAQIDYYQAKYADLHDPNKMHEIRTANRRLSPYVDA